MKRALVAWIMGTIAAAAAPAVIEIPWAVDPLNTTNYTRTNLPAWYDSTNDYSSGVSPWRMSQAINENFRRVTNAIATNSPQGLICFRAGPITAYIGETTNLLAEGIVGSATITAGLLTAGKRFVVEAIPSSLTLYDTLPTYYLTLGGTNLWTLSDPLSGGICGRFVLTVTCVEAGQSGRLVVSRDLYGNSSSSSETAELDFDTTQAAAIEFHVDGTGSTSGEDVFRLVRVFSVP